MLRKRVKNVKKVINEFVAELNQQIDVEKVILFGSYARNKPRDYSDIDLVIISPDFRGGTQTDCKILDQAARKVNPLIEAIPYTPSDFENYEKGDFVSEIKRTGKVIYKKAA